MDSANVAGITAAGNMQPLLASNPDLSLELMTLPTFPSQIFEKRINFHLCGWKIHTAVKALTTWAS